MISAIVLTKNEEKSIGKCLASVSWCDEVIVLDDYSTDKTAVIAKQTGATVFQRKVDDDFAAQRNFGLKKAKEEWVLFVDADEQVPLALQDEILQLFHYPMSKYQGFFLPRRDYLWGKPLYYGETGKISFLRLGRKSSGVWEGKVHEVWRISGPTKQLTHALNHFPHQTVTKFLQEVNYYTDIRSHELLSQGKSASSASIILYPLGKFFLNYFIKAGFLDKVPGLVVAFMMSFHSFLVRAKLWTLRNKPYAK